MSLYLEGLEMPRIGYYEIRIRPNGTVTENIDGREETVGKVIYFPPHGLFADVNAIRNEVNRECDRYDAGIIDELTCLNRIIAAINNAPTIIHTEE